jgi:uncharacterized protein YpmB
MENRSIVSLGVVMLVVSMGLAFYWYEYRPSRIRATCETQSTEQAVEFFKKLTRKKNSEGMYMQANKESYYVDCLRQHGLER